MSTSPSRPSAYHHGDLRAGLVAAGLAILDETGDPGILSLREAARRAGVSAMAPYRHFADKDALLAAIATVGFEKLREALLAADRAAGEPPARHEEALIGQGVAYVAFACAQPALFRLMFATRISVRPDTLVAASLASYAVMVERVATIVPPEAVQERALQCWATAHGIAALSIDGQFDEASGSPTELAERLLRLCGTPFERAAGPT